MLAPVSVHAHDETLFILHTHLVVDILLNAASEETLEKAQEEEKTLKSVFCGNVSTLVPTDNKDMT